MQLGATSQSRIKELESYAAFVHRDKGTSQKYVPPDKGVLKIEVQECLSFDELFGCITNRQVTIRSFKSNSTLWIYHLL